jgi:hypothetical protein
LVLENTLHWHGGTSTFAGCKWQVPRAEAPKAFDAARRPFKLNVATRSFLKYTSRLRVTPPLAKKPARRQLAS